MLGNATFKTLRDRRRSLFWWVVGIFGYLVGIGAVYPIVRDNQDQFEALLETYPDELLAIMGVGEESLFDPVGFMRAEAFGWIVPLVFAIYGAAQGARAVAGEEEAGTIDLVMATPLSRFGLVWQKWLALVLTEMVLGLALFVSLALDNVLFGMDIPLGNSAAGCFMAVLLGVFFGSLALAVGAGTGLRGFSLGVVTLVAAGSYLLNSLGGLVEGLDPLKPLSPFYYYDASNPLRYGLDAQHTLVLAGLAVVLMVIGLLAVRRRDLGVGGIRLPMPQIGRAAG
ncbi:MAG: ABC transporter permease subunit [bacterium]|nr:ABC transporter permease [Acidimicrobiia bacterium]MCY4650305.1 ABC transporter permease subunit [bacterium]